MRKTVAMMMCLLMFVMILPGQAMANDQAKDEFIRNYMKFMDQSLQMQKSVMENIQDQTVKINMSAQLSDSEVTMSDGTQISNIAGNGSLELTGNMLNRTGKVSFNGQFLDKQVEGTLYLSEEGVIIPRETIESLSRAGMEDFLELQDLADLPQYIVYDMDLSAEDQAMLAEMFNNNMVMYDKYPQIQAFIEELLNVIPADCFYYSDGCAVLDLKTSLLNSSGLVMNLKKHSESLAEKFVPIVSQPSDMSDEEFRIFQEGMKSEIVAGIESIDIKELAELELPFNMDEFRIFSTSNSIRTAIHICSDLDGSTFDLVINSNARYSAGNVLSDFKGTIKVDSSELLVDLVIDTKGSASPAGETLDMTMSGTIKAPDGMAKGKIKFNMQVDYDSPDNFVLPVLNENNSITIKENSLNMNNELEGFLNQDGINVYIDDWPMYFEDVPPLLIDGHTMVPLREFAEGIGCDVTWQPPDTVIISKGYDDDLMIKINSAEYQVGSQSYKMDIAPQIIDDYTYVPLRPVAEFLEFKVDWDQDTNSVLLMSE